MRRTRSCKTSGRVFWPQRWTRSHGTLCVSPSFRLLSKWILWTLSFSKRSTLMERDLEYKWLRRDSKQARVCPISEVLVSFEHLAELNCISFQDSSGQRIQPYPKPFGTLLMNVVTG